MGSFTYLVYYNEHTFQCTLLDLADLYFFCDNIANKISPFPCEGIQKTLKNPQQTKPKLLRP